MFIGDISKAATSLLESAWTMTRLSQKSFVVMRMPSAVHWIGNQLSLATLAKQSVEAFAAFRPRSVIFSNSAEQLLCLQHVSKEIGSAYETLPAVYSYTSTNRLGGSPEMDYCPHFAIGLSNRALCGCLKGKEKCQPVERSPKDSTADILRCLHQHYKRHQPVYESWRRVASWGCVGFPVADCLPKCLRT